ncbi:DNA-binding transcriptional regulator, GntR family [Kaistia soli DSM 19436]|uniref:DNA-binding transcriptional regulator, GntR family n=1 Tax=Kaistia soli DSM 19436 TaxID=1122133 RepID=A0A1M5GB29_9HYPH|nr:GntR family transcriptional regulator [Kaistia soli]SHG00671.1 DNA-binding transcriptional regulator, GntR family [Kaistia soli DSM 19436]
MLAAENPPTFSKTDHAYETLRRRILDGTLKPGERLRLSHIAGELGLSEMPVREALRLLHKDGLVLLNLHRSAEVARLSFQSAWEIEEVRLRLEAFACAAAAPYHDAETVKSMRWLIGELQLDLEHPVATARGNRAFHTLLMSRAPNAFLRAHIQELWDRTWQYSSASFFDFMPDRTPMLPVENNRIVDLIEQRDQKGLENYLAERLDNICMAWSRAVRRAQQAQPAAI